MTEPLGIPSISQQNSKNETLLDVVQHLRVPHPYFIQPTSDPGHFPDGDVRGLRQLKMAKHVSTR